MTMNTRNKLPRRFLLERHVDVSGVSGVGVVAWGVQFGDGRVVTHWNADTAQTSVWLSIDDMMSVHGHGGATELIWIDSGNDAMFEQQ